MGSPVTGTRDLGEFAVVDALPEAVIVAFAAITHLADPWFLFALLAIVYWVADERVAENPRHVGATAIALLTCTYAAVAVGKAVTALPRPRRSDPTMAVAMEAPSWLPGVLNGWYSTQLVSDGFGFPSGHAAAGVIAYGTLALLLTRLWTPTYRIALAGLLTIAIAFSRVAIGAHYLVDILVGGALGIVVLVVGLRIAADRRARFASSDHDLDPTGVFLLAAGLSAIVVLVTGSGGFAGDVVEAGIGLGAGVGGAVGWSFVSGDEPALPPRVAFVWTMVAGGLWIGASSLSSGVGPWSLSPGLAVVSTASAFVLLLAVPSLACRFGR